MYFNDDVGMDLIDDCGAYEALADSVDAEDEFDDMDDEILEFVEDTDADHAAYVKAALSDDELADLADRADQLALQADDLRQDIFDWQMNSY